MKSSVGNCLDLDGKSHVKRDILQGDTNNHAALDTEPVCMHDAHTHPSEVRSGLGRVHKCLLRQRKTPQGVERMLRSS